MLRRISDPRIHSAYLEQKSPPTMGLFSERQVKGTQSAYFCVSELTQIPSVYGNRKSPVQSIFYGNISARYDMSISPCQSRFAPSPREAETNVEIKRMWRVASGILYCFSGKLENRFEAEEFD